MTFTTTILAAPVPVEKRPVDSISEYYSVDTTDHTIDVGDTALIFFLGPWEKARPLALSQALASLTICASA
jgi:hypothetical protein